MNLRRVRNLLPALAIAASAAPPPGEPAGLLRAMLAGPMAGVTDIVFAIRVSGRDHWYANFGNYASDLREPKDRAFKFEDGVYWAYGEGAQLCRLNLRTGELRVLLDDPRGGIRDPQVHYDGDRVLFSWRRGGTHVHHLYEMPLDGHAPPRQLTDGPDDDIEPTWLPDGRIVFISARCRRFVNCWHTRVGALYTCAPDGSGVRMLSPNLEHENTPWPLPDGRILYMRWEYVDRSQLDFHHLWTMNPDGTQVLAFFGNQNPGNVMLDAKPIDGTPLIVASFSPGHGRPEHEGRLAVVDPRFGPDHAAAVRYIGTRSDIRDPWAFGTNCFLVADRDGISVIDGDGRREVVWRRPPALAAMSPRRDAHEPRPVIRRAREARVPDRVDLARAHGEMVLHNVYLGRNMTGVKPGEIRSLLVLEQLPKPVNFSGGMEPLTMGGSFTLARVLGTVPVEPDGSARFEVPALRPVFFVALDAEGLAVKRMQSWCSVQPGERIGCVGCHEPRTHAMPVAQPPAAARRPADRIEPVPGVPDVLDFSRDVQPVLDRHCVRCHNPEQYAGRLDLTGGRTPRYRTSYQNIVRRRLIADGRNEPRGNRPPRSIGSSASRLLQVLRAGHHNVRLDARELSVLRLWIETSATYPGTYAALGSGEAPVRLPAAALRRCGECHLRDAKDSRGQPVQQWSFGVRPEWLCNLDEPERSILLRAPLAKEAGGLGLCPGFASKDAPDYREILSAIVTASNTLQQVRRFDMPGFRPNRHYVREMQRFGILPAGLSERDPVDPYATDRAYWESFHYRPPPASAAR
ncbi:MAG: hypothetical protein N2652_03020 [Kiritimatiellae bacterium]|nr:hypothetical protein [Kiritimatiellia bacterium]